MKQPQVKYVHSAHILEPSQVFLLQWSSLETTALACVADLSSIVHIPPQIKIGALYLEETSFL